MDDYDKIGCLMLLLAAVVLLFGLTALTLDQQLTQARFDLRLAQPEVAKPIWCDEFNKCYLMKSWMDITNISSEEPYTFEVVNGFNVKHITIEEVEVK